MLHDRVSVGRLVPAVAVLAVMLAGLGLLAPATVGAQDVRTYESSLTYNCPTGDGPEITATLEVTNNGDDPIDVVAFQRSFTVAPGDTASETFDEDSLTGFAESPGAITIDDEPVEGLVLATPSCVPQLSYELGISRTCAEQPDGSSADEVTIDVANTGASAIDVEAGTATFAVEAGDTVSQVVSPDVSVDDITVNGLPVDASKVAVIEAPCVGPNPPSSTDDPPSTNDGVAPIAQPLSPTFTG